MKPTLQLPPFARVPVLLALLALAACGPVLSRQPVMPVFSALLPGASYPAETGLTRILLEGPAAQAGAEISGLAWYGDTLILLPQYPERMSDTANGVIFALSKAEILAYLDSENPQPLRPREIILVQNLLNKKIRGFEGYEAIAFSGNSAFLTVEASPGKLMKSYVVRGEIEPDLSRMFLDAGKLVEIEHDVQIMNFSHEALLVRGEQVIVFFEANGEEAASGARAAVYDLDLNLLHRLDMPPLEYRLTDATGPDENGRVWVSNFFFPGDARIFPSHDALADQFGWGRTHAAASVVERLVELQLPPEDGGSVSFSGTAPLQFALAAGHIPRNWEGLARLDERGFLVVTDKFPVTILAFVPFAGQ
jgi:hypothetical protein